MSAFRGSNTFAESQIVAVGFPAHVAELLINECACGLFVKVDYPHGLTGGLRKGHSLHGSLTLCLFGHLDDLPFCILCKVFPDLALLSFALVAFFRTFRHQKRLLFFFFGFLGGSQSVITL